MLASALASFIHFLAAFGIAAVLLAEWVLLQKAPDLPQARLIQRLDGLYGLSAVTLLVVGALRVLWFEKGWAYYSTQPLFHAKLALFVAIGLLSITPTVRFIRWRRDTRQGRAPTLSDSERVKLRRLVAAQLALLPFVILCASGMARGLG